jgi:hypothetical protein
MEFPKINIRLLKPCIKAVLPLYWSLPCSMVFLQKPVPENLLTVQVIHQNAIYVFTYENFLAKKVLRNWM